MARKKDLGSLAALAGLAYMASRDKEGGGPAPSAPSAAPTAASADTGGDFIEAGSGPSGDFMSEKEPGWNSGTAPTRSTAVKAKPVAAKAPSNPDYGNEGRRTVKEATSKPAYETPYDRARREDREAGRDIGSVVESLKKRIATAGERGSALPLKGTKSDKNDFMGSGMKKGGSVKGWGIARGSRKAKNY